MAVATQEWTHSLSIMQQSVLLSAIRGCDGIAKRHKAKPLIKWYRRCLLVSAFDGRALTTPYEPGGGSFTGPILEMPAGIPDGVRHDMMCSALQKAADDFLDSRDELPLHYVTHAMHAFQIVGFKHPDEAIRDFWADVYDRLAKAFHLWPESEAQMDARLGDDQGKWQARADRSSSCSD
jgi:hypothetical protein